MASINASCAMVTLPQLIPLTIQYLLSLNSIVVRPPLGVQQVWMSLGFRV